LKLLQEDQKKSKKFQRKTFLCICQRSSYHFIQQQVIKQKHPNQPPPETSNCEEVFDQIFSFRVFQTKQNEKENFGLKCAIFDFSSFLGVKI